MSAGKSLSELIELAKDYEMSPEEVYAQRRSFVRGMCPFDQDYEAWCRVVDRILPPLEKGKPA